MNLPNKLTVLRVVLVPVFLFFLLMPKTPNEVYIPNSYLWACIVFAVASFTDYLDGYLARKNNMVTTFGKFLDPLADKMLVTAALVAFVQLGLAGAVPVIIIIARDLMVSAIRMVAVSSDGKVIAANWWGKVKTALQMFAIIGVLLACHIVRPDTCIIWVNQLGSMIAQSVKFWSNITMWALAAYTLVSGLVYVFQNKSLINTFK